MKSVRGAFQSTEISPAPRKRGAGQRSARRPRSNEATHNTESMTQLKADVMRVALNGTRKGRLIGKLLFAAIPELMEA